MATKRKRKNAPRKAAAEAEAPKPKRRKRKAATKRKRSSKSKSTKRAASGAFVSSKRGSRKPLQLVLRVQDVPINSPALARLSDAQRVDLAAMDARRRTFSTRPAWATDESIWRKAIRTVTPHWSKLRNPWPTVAWVYLHSDGPIGEGRRGMVDREDERENKAKSRRGSARAHTTTESTRDDYDAADSGSESLRVERVHVDETGIDDNGVHRGRGTWWRVFNASLDSVVRAASAGAARAVGARMLRATQ